MLIEIIRVVLVKPRSMEHEVPYPFLKEPSLIAEAVPQAIPCARSWPSLVTSICWEAHWSVSRRAWMCSRRDCGCVTGVGLSVPMLVRIASICGDRNRTVAGTTLGGRLVVIGPGWNLRRLVRLGMVVHEVKFIPVDWYRRFSDGEYVHCQSDIKVQLPRG